MVDKLATALVNLVNKVGKPGPAQYAVFALRGLVELEAISPTTQEAEREHSRDTLGGHKNSSNRLTSFHKQPSFKHDRMRDSSAVRDTGASLSLRPTMGSRLQSMGTMAGLRDSSMGPNKGLPAVKSGGGGMFSAMGFGRKHEDKFLVDYEKLSSKMVAAVCISEGELYNAAMAMLTGEHDYKESFGPVEAFGKKIEFPKVCWHAEFTTSELGHPST